jgi:hypothetical protein
MTCSNKWVQSVFNRYNGVLDSTTVILELIALALFRVVFTPLKWSSRWSPNSWTIFNPKPPAIGYFFMLKFQQQISANLWHRAHCDPWTSKHCNISILIILDVCCPNLHELWELFYLRQFLSKQLVWSNPKVLLKMFCTYMNVHL